MRRATVEMAKHFAAFLSLLLITACSSAPRYTPHIESHSATDLVIRLDFARSVDGEAMTRALLREAARAAIDRGAVYLRIDQVSVGESSTTFAKPSPEDPRVVQSGPGEGAPDIEKVVYVLAAVSIARQQSGSVSITLADGAVPGDHVFEAVKLLDSLRSSDSAAALAKSNR